MKREIVIWKREAEVSDAQKAHDVLDMWLKTMPNGQWTLKMEKTKSQRTVSQNALLWLWMEAASQWWYEASGVRYTKEQMKEYFARLFLPVTDPDGNTIGGSTSGLGTEQMTEFLENIRVYALEKWGLELPLPEDNMFNEWRAQYE